MKDATEYINVYFQYNRAYCKYCFIKVAFGGNEKMLVHHVNDDFFVDSMGKPFDTINDNTVQYESFNHQLIPWKGIKCDECGNTCIDPDESDIRKHRFIFDDENTRDTFEEYVKSQGIAVDNEVDITEDFDEMHTYEAIFYTYTEIDDYELKYMLQTYHVASYEVNVPQERW